LGLIILWLEISPAAGRADRSSQKELERERDSFKYWGPYNRTLLMDVSSLEFLGFHQLSKALKGLVIKPFRIFFSF